MQIEPPRADPPKRKRRWLPFTADPLLLTLLAVEVIILLSAIFRWFGRYEDKAWTAWIAVVCVAIAIIVALLRPILRVRRWYQFSLRSLLIFTLICSVASAWVTRRMEQKRLEREAVSAILKDGGDVLHDYQIESYGFNRSAKPTGPNWLRKLLGENFFSEVESVTVRVRGIPKSASKMMSLDELAHVHRLILEGTNVTNAALIHVEGLTQLQTLYMDGTGITDAGLEHLKGLTRLQNLGLGFANVSDVGLVNLKSLHQLRYLQLNGTHVSAEGLTDLQKALPACFIRFERSAPRQ
jgi:hypothetical protein